MIALNRKKPTRESRQYHHGDLRRALLDAALDVIREQGVRGLSLRGVARRVGVSHMAPYNHFDDKNALIAAVAEEGFRELAREMSERMAAQGDDPLARLQVSGIAYVVFAVKNPDHFRLMFGPVASDASSHPGLAEAAQETLDVLMDNVGRSASSGAIQSPENEETALLAWSAVHGLAMLLVSNQLGTASVDQAESMAKTVTRSLFRGLDPRG